jgi:hypothetical protein
MEPFLTDIPNSTQSFATFKIRRSTMSGNRSKGEYLTSVEKV